MDTSHVKQVASFEKLVGFCNAHGAMFNPSKVALQPAALGTLLTSAQESIEAVRTARTVYVQAVNARNEAFSILPKFITRVVNALAVTDASKSMIADAYRIARRYRWSLRKAEAPQEEAGRVQPKAGTISQQDFDSKADNFEELVKLVSTEPSYQPNEPDLQIGALQAKVVELKALNTAVISAQVGVSNARAQRNRKLYDTLGIHGLAMAAKRYIKGAFGTQSVAYNQVKGLRFINLKF